MYFFIIPSNQVHTASFLTHHRSRADTQERTLRKKEIAWMKGHYTKKTEDTIYKVGESVFRKIICYNT